VVTGAQRSYLGIGAAEVTSERAKALNLKEERGAEVTSVFEDSPAAKAGIKEGDVVLEYNGQPVQSMAQLTRMVQETPIGRQVKIGVWRNGSMQTLTATIGENKGRQIFGSSGRTLVVPDMQHFEIPQLNMDIPQMQMLWRNPTLGITGEALREQAQLADFFGVKEGVLVKTVAKGSAAEKAGIKAGDVITKIDDKAVNTTEDIRRSLSGAGKSSLNVTLVRNKKDMTVTVTIENRGSNPNGKRAEAFMVASV
jgi:serine protease Do